MAQAAKAHSTVMPIRRDHARDARLADAMSRMEGDLNNVKRMADIAVVVTEDALDYQSAEKLANGRHRFVFDDDDCERMIFAAFQTYRMIEELLTEYYAVMHGQVA